MKTKAPPDLSKEPIPQTDERYHVVRRGESLYKIARKYRLSVGELRRLNDISPDQIIQPGQKLLIAPEKNQ